MYTLVDLKTDLISGPFPTFNAARDAAERFSAWEIVRDGDDALVAWS